MSTRFEYVGPERIAFVNELDLASENNIEDPFDQDVLVLWYDEAIVIPGDAEEQLDFAQRIIETVNGRTRNGRAKRICRHCDKDIHNTSGVDPSVPWVHSATGNAACDVDVPEDAVMFAGTPGRTFAAPFELDEATGEIS